MRCSTTLTGLHKSSARLLNRCVFTSVFCLLFLLTSQYVSAQSPLDQINLVYPGNTGQEISVESAFEWQEVAGDVTYDIQLSVSNDFSDPLFTESGITTPSVSITDIVDYGTTYYWRVRAADSLRSGEWSDIWSFTTRLPLPEKVTLGNPVSEADGISLNPELYWEASNHAEVYEFMISDESGLGEPVILAAGMTENSFRVSEDLEYATTYYWRVRAVNSTGEGEWSELSSFTTLVPPPEPVILSLPVDGLSDIELLPELFWENSEYSESYDLRVSEQLDLSNPVIDENGLSTNSYQLSEELDYNRTYYWQVRGVNSTGEGEWSIVASFLTKSPDDFALYQNFPNPFSQNGPGTTIRFRIPEDGRVRLYLHDSTGRRAATILDEEMVAGEHEIPFNGRGLAATIYYYMLIFEQEQTTKTMIILN